MKKRNTMKEGNPNPKQECSDLAKSFLSFTKLNIFHKDLLTYLTGNIWQPNGLTKILLKLSIGSATHFWPFSQVYWLQIIPRKLGQLVATQGPRQTSKKPKHYLVKHFIVKLAFRWCKGTKFLQIKPKLCFTQNIMK